MNGICLTVMTIQASGVAPICLVFSMDLGRGSDLSNIHNPSSDPRHLARVRLICCGVDCGRFEDPETVGANI